jgi:RNA polymerase-interacting CarD/CdnL/TRCF family regulator
MQYNIGDLVVHPAYGTGRIASIEKKQFSEKSARLYYQIVLPKLTVWVPVDIQQAVGLRLVTAKDDLEQYRHLLRSPPVPLTVNHHRRHLELVNRLKEGSFQGMCEVVRDLTAWGWRKPLGRTDTVLLQKARSTLQQEWATAAGVSTTEASKEIDSLLLPAQ